MLEEWNWIIGRVVAPFSRFGELKVQPETDFPERFADLEKVCLRLKSGESRLFSVCRARIHKGQVLLKLQQLESIDDAERWRGAQVLIRKEEAVLLPKGSYYAAD